MKNIKSFKSSFLVLCFTALAVMASGGLATADQQGYPSTIQQLTNVPATQVGGAVSVWTNNYIPLRSTGLGIQDIFTASNASTAPVTLYFYPTVDGTNAFTVPWASLIIPANGTNLVVGGTNWSQLNLRGFAGMYVAVSNGSATTILQSTTVSNGFTGNTNVAGGLWFNRPNQ